MSTLLADTALSDTAVQLELSLSDLEQDQLRRYEAAIEEGLTTFFTVGNALLMIREQRLYRATHKTFEDYCQERWELKSSRAYQLMSAAGIVEELRGSSTIVELPANEAQTRPLAALPTPEERQEAWREVTETTPPKARTAAQVQTVVDKRLGRETKKAGVSDTLPAPSAEPVQEVLPPEAPAPAATPAPAPAPSESAHHPPAHLAEAVKEPAQQEVSAPPKDDGDHRATVVALAPSKMVVNLVYESDQNWLNENGLTVSVALAQLRDYKDREWEGELYTVRLSAGEWARVRAICEQRNLPVMSFFKQCIDQAYAALKNEG